MTLIWLLQELTDEVHSSSQRFGLKINVEKTKTMTIGMQRKTVEIKREGETLEQVTEFIYLGGVITENGRCTKGIKRRIGLASAMFGTMNKQYNNNNQGETIRNICHPGDDVRVRVLVPQKRR